MTANKNRLPVDGCDCKFCAPFFKRADYMEDVLTANMMDHLYLTDNKYTTVNNGEPPAGFIVSLPTEDNDFTLAAVLY